MSLWKRSKSWEVVLDKLNEKPELSAEKLMNEGHLFCWEKSSIKNTKLAPSEPMADDFNYCIMCKAIPQGEEELLDALCYNFEWTGGNYTFTIVPAWDDDSGDITYQKSSTKWELAGSRSYMWEMQTCPEPIPIELMEFEELIDLNSADDILEELNAAPEAYFDKYNTEWHITADDVLAMGSDCDNAWCMCFYDYYFYFIPSRAAQSNRWYRSGCRK